MSQQITLTRAENQPIVEAVSVYGGCFVKAYTVPDAGTILPQHSHRHSHMTALISGSVRVWCDGELKGDFTAPALIQIPALTLHKFLTLTPAVGLMCIHSVDAADGEEVEDDHLVHEAHEIQMEG